MKRFLAFLLVLTLCLGCLSASGEGGVNLLTIREWIDMKGECGDCYILAVVRVINNPMLASICDDTASVNLFTMMDENGICEGDILVLHSPEYNEYEGTVEMAFPEIVRRIHIEKGGAERVPALTSEFTVSPEEDIFINNQLFEDEVVISGAGRNIIFSNCEFRANVVCTCAADTQVQIMSDCEFAEGAHCVLISGVREADMYYPLPKFILTFPVEVECTDLGAVIAGAFDVLFNGETYSIADAMYIETADGGILPYDGSANCSVNVVGQWWENGEKVIFTLCAE